MRKTLRASLVLCLALATFPLVADQQEMSAKEKAMMEAWQKSMTPGPAHKALDGMVGTWDTVVKSWMAPGAPPAESTGTSEHRWVLGGRWVEQRFNGTFMGMPFEGVGYTGYDNVKKQYVGSWMDNMSTGVMTSTGQASKDGKTWTFKASMSDPMTGKTSYSDEKITVIDNDHHVMEMWGPSHDGKVKKYKMMEISYSRKK